MPLPDRGWRAMAMLSLKVATEIWSPEHSSARMHRLLGPASVCAPFLRSCCSDLTVNGLWEKRSGLCQAECPNPFGWLVGRVTASKVGHHDRRRDSNSFEQCTQCVTRKLQKTDDIPTCTVCRMPMSWPTPSQPDFFTKTPTYAPFQVPCLLSQTSRPSSGVPLFRAPSATRINLAKVYIEVIGAPNLLAALRLPARLRLTRHCPSGGGVWWRRLACPLCESLSWLFQEVICILQCCY